MVLCTTSIKFHNLSFVKGYLYKTSAGMWGMKLNEYTHQLIDHISNILLTKKAGQVDVKICFISPVSVFPDTLSLNDGTCNYQAYIQLIYLILSKLLNFVKYRKRNSISFYKGIIVFSIIIIYFFIQTV